MAIGTAKERLRDDCDCRAKSLAGFGQRPTIETDLICKVAEGAARTCAGRLFLTAEKFFNKTIVCY